MGHLINQEVNGSADKLGSHQPGREMCHLSGHVLSVSSDKQEVGVSLSALGNRCVTCLDKIQVCHLSNQEVSVCLFPGQELYHLLG